MAIDGILLSAIKSDLKHKLTGGRINKIYQPESDILTLNIRQPGKNYKLLVSINPRHGRIHITDIDLENPDHPPDFCMLLRKYLTNANIKDIKQPDFERIIYIEIEQHNKLYFLIIEVMGKYCNTILINEDKIILDAMKRINKDMNKERQLYPGIKYQPPAAQDKLNPLKVNKNDFFNKIPEDFSKDSYRAILYNFRGIGPQMAKEFIYRGDIDYEQPYSNLKQKQKNKIWENFKSIFAEVKNSDYNLSIGEKREEIDYTSAFKLTHKNNIDNIINFTQTGKMFDYYYKKEIKQKKFDKISNRLLKTISDYLKKNNKQQKKFKGIIKDTQNAKEYQKKGELLKAYTNKLKNDTQKIKVKNFYDPEQKEIEISVDPDLSPGENIERYFNKYEKAKKIRKHARRELGKLVHEEKYLEQVKLNIEQADIEADLEEIENELIEEDYLENNSRANKNKSNKPLPPHKFKSSQDYDIIVGRNSKQNDYITKKVANNHDIWVHTKKIAGAHVIIRNHTRKKIPEQTIKEAAILAASFSKAKMSENVPVDYTQIKNVNKPKGAKPGLVYYDEYQTMYVDPDQDLVKKLKTN